MPAQLLGMLPLKSLPARPRLLSAARLPHSSGRLPVSLLLCRNSCLSLFMRPHALGRGPVREQPYKETSRRRSWVDHDEGNEPACMCTTST